MDTTQEGQKKSFYVTSFEAFKHLDSRIYDTLKERTHISRNINEEFGEKLTFGQRFILAVRVLLPDWLP